VVHEELMDFVVLITFNLSSTSNPQTFCVAFSELCVVVFFFYFMFYNPNFS
jgi:hypothetical protein